MSGLGAQTDLFGQDAQVRIDECSTVWEEDDGQAMLALVHPFHDLTGRLVLLDVLPQVGDAVAGQEILHVVAFGRPERTRHPNAVESGWNCPQPVTEQIIQHRVEILLWGVPGLH